MLFRRTVKALQVLGSKLYCPRRRMSSLPHERHSRLISGQVVLGQSNKSYRLIRALNIHDSAPLVPCIWKAVDVISASEHFVVKGPREYDDPTNGWPLFHHELRMQKLFSQSPFIRKMVDEVAATADQPPLMVLQPFEKTLWTARTQRSMSNREIKWIMKGVLLGLWTIHREGLVYTDLKPENVLLNGFDKAGKNDVRSLIVRLADCGTIAYPSDREITSISYRSPEVYFAKSWTASTDIWSWGIMYCHLLEAQACLTEPGLYESVGKHRLEDKASAVREAMILDFDLISHPFYHHVQEWRDPSAGGSASASTLADRWDKRLSRKGVATEDLEFLSQILDPDPHGRPTASDIIASGYLEIE